MAKRIKGITKLFLKDLSRTVKVLKQVGESVMSRDVVREAKLPGKRISNTGKIYWETRKNRSDRLSKAT